jgi:hypothetical protein
MTGAHGRPGRIPEGWGESGRRGHDVLDSGGDSENDYQVQKPSVPGPTLLLRRFTPAVLLPVLGLAFAACATPLPAPSEADASRAAVQWPGTTVATLERGRSTYLDHCTSCHAPYRPDAQPAHAWPRIVEKMATRSKLGPSGKQDVIRYLVASSAR